MAIEFPRTIIGGIRLHVKDDIALGGSHIVPPRRAAFIGACRKTLTKVLIAHRIVILSDSEHKNALTIFIGERIVCVGHGRNHANASASVLVSEINDCNFILRCLSRSQNGRPDNLPCVRSICANVLTRLVKWWSGRGLVGRWARRRKSIRKRHRDQWGNYGPK